MLGASCWGTGGSSKAEGGKTPASASCVCPPLTLSEALSLREGFVNKVSFEQKLKKVREQAIQVSLGEGHLWQRKVGTKTCRSRRAPVVFSDQENSSERR